MPRGGTVYRDPVLIRSSDGSSEALIWLDTTALSFKLHLVDYEAQALKEMLFKTENKLASAESAIDRAINELEKTYPDKKDLIEKALKALRGYRPLL